MKTIGKIVLIKHDGSTKDWQIRSAVDEEMNRLNEVFESARGLCRKEIDEGGTLYLYDKNDNLLREVRSFM